MSAKHWLGSAIWSSATSAARVSAKWGWIASERLEAGRVISVGNLQAGGAGKTPLVAQIAREAVGRGLHTCILSRGYLSDWEIHGGLIEPDSNPVDPDLSGDEPALLQNLEPRVYIAVGADRVCQYSRAKEKLGSPFDLVILDDGFQHLKVRRDTDVLALTSATPSETYFRDRPEFAARADLLVWTKGSRPPETYGRPLVETRYRLPQSDGEKVWLICGVADPAHVMASVRRAGYEVCRDIALGDHATYELSMIERWLRNAEADGCKIAITGKDWVKWRSMGIPRASVIVLEPELVFESGREHWDRVIWEQ